MSGAGVHVGRLRAGAWRRTGAPAAPAVVAAAPLVAILCAPQRARVSAAAVALALADAVGERAALAGAIGLSRAAAVGGTPAARRVAARLRARELPSTAAGRLAWIVDRRHETGAGDGTTGSAGAAAIECDEAGVAAAAAAELGRAASAAAAPAALALPFARTAALDRVLAWHDAIVVVREPELSAALFERALAGLAALGPPVAPMAPPTRVGAASAAVGLRAPREAAGVVAQLGLAVRDDRGRRRG